MISFNGTVKYFVLFITIPDLVGFDTDAELAADVGAGAVVAGLDVYVYGDHHVRESKPFVERIFR
jgi:hypothetical protein